MKKVLIISTSLRKDSNSECLAKEFGRGAKDAGNKVETVTLRGKDIRFCIGCMSCMDTHRCVLNDDSQEIVSEIKESDVLVFATPVYYYEMSGQMKTLLDRCNPLYNSDYKFKEVYLMTSAAENEESAMDGAVKGMEGWIECFPGVKLSGVLRGTGLEDPGEAARSEYVKQAYDMGKNI